MKYSLVPVLLVFTFLLTAFGLKSTDGNADKNSTDYSTTIKEAKKKIHRLMRRHHLPGFSIAMVDDQEIVYMESFGYSDLDNQNKISEETLFKLWSVAKPFTAMEIFREVEEGLIDLDEPIITYLPDFSIQSDFADQKLITVRNILAHRSGLPRNECVIVPGDSDDPEALVRFEKATSDCYMAYPVEYRYKYSNLGYDLLGRIVEHNRGENFPGYMDRNLLKSLGMTNSTFNSKTIVELEKIAKGYEFYKGKYYPMDQSKDINSIPSGNLYASIDDLSVFLKAAFSNIIFNNDKTFSNMFTDCFSTTSDPETMGLGWKTSRISDEEILVWHDGGPDDGTGALIAFLPEQKLGLAVISNSTGFGSNISVPLVKEIFELMIEDKFDIEPDQHVKMQRINPGRGELQVYEGKYVAFSRIMEVKAKSRKLKGKISGIGLDLIPVGDSSFKITHWTEKIGLTKIIRPPVDFDKLKIEFQFCNSGEPCQMIINMDNISYEICPKYPELKEVQNTWGSIAGKYRMAYRKPENKPGELTGRYFDISHHDHVLSMSDPFGPVIPRDDKIMIAGGPFAGERMEYDKETGNLIHQNAVFLPVDN